MISGDDHHTLVASGVDGDRKTYRLRPRVRHRQGHCHYSELNSNDDKCPQCPSGHPLNVWHGVEKGKGVTMPDLSIGSI